MSESGYAVFCGLDVGKITHHAVALDPAGARLHEAPLPQDEARADVTVVPQTPAVAYLWHE